MDDARLEARHRRDSDTTGVASRIMTQEENSNE